MQRLWFFFSLLIIVLLAGSPAVAALAQEEQPTEPVPLTLFTNFPSQVVGLGETVSLELILRGGKAAQVVSLEVSESPKDWDVTFRGEGKIVKSAYLEPDVDSTIDLRLDPGSEVAAGTYKFVLLATGLEEKAELTIEITVQEQLPPAIALDADLPTLRGTPSTTFRYDVTLKNEGDTELSVNLTADAPGAFLVKFRLSGQEITNVPLAAKETKRLSVEAQPIADVEAGTFPIVIRAEGTEATAELQLAAEVTGQAELTVTAPDGRLSGTAYAGRDSTLKVVLSNSGSAPARAIELTSSAPTGWSVTFDNSQIAEIPAGEQVEVNATIRPGEQAVAGDYVISVSARPAEGATRSAEYRITVLTSTLWGVVGIVLIAIAVGVVALAVMRFGRR